MSFAAAFLPGRESYDDDRMIADHVDVLLQAVVPGPVVPPSLPCVQASNLAYGVAMNWALSDSQRSEVVRGNLRRRLELFEPRLTSVSSIDVSEDDQGNLVEFVIEGALRRGREREEVEVRSRVSLMDQALVEEAV